MSNGSDQQSASFGSKNKRQEISKFHPTKEGTQHNDLWKDGLICAFELVRGQSMHDSEKLRSKSESDLVIDSAKKKQASEDFTDLALRDSSLIDIKHIDDPKEKGKHVKSFLDRHWVPIGWVRISELVQFVRADANWESEQFNFGDEEDDITVADVLSPYWERPVGPTWWCHVAAGHPNVDAWLNNAQWLHPAISIALRDESRLISEKMKHLLYEVPVRVAGGLLFELLGQSVGDPFRDEDDIPIVLRSWQAQNFLVTALHLKGSASTINVIGLNEVQDLLASGGSAAPKSIHALIAHIACRLSRWDDRLFRKYVFGAADEIELKFVNRRTNEDLHLLSIILNQEIKRLSTQVIRVKWSLHAREEIVFELLQHLRGSATRTMLEGIRKNSREMLEEQEAARGRLFTIQDVMQSTVRAWLQDRSLRITHNLAVFGGCGLVLSIITGLFGINVDGIPGAQNTPYAFGLFAGLLFLLGIILIGLGMIYLGLQKPVSEEKVEVRKLELQQLVNVFQHDAETHAKLRDGVSRNNISPTAADMIPETGYVLLPS